MGWDKQADTADATLGKLHPAGSLVALMTSWKPMILRLCKELDVTEGLTLSLSVS